MFLNVGVRDVPYMGQPTTTFKVAKILQEKYKVFNRFPKKYRSALTDVVVSSLASTLAGNLKNPEKRITAQCTEMLKKYWRQGEHGFIPKGPQVSSRFKNKKRPRKPLMDTYTLYDDLKVWMKI